MTASHLSGTSDSLVETPVGDLSRLHGLKNIPDAVVEAQILYYEDRVSRLDLLRRHLENIDPTLARESGLTQRVSALREEIQLRELHFENLSPRPTRMSGRFEFALRLGWGSFRAWKDEFLAMARMDGVGWVTLLMDPVEYQLCHQGVPLDGRNHPSGFLPVLVLDVSSRALNGMEREAYLEALFENIDWTCVEDRHAISETAPELRGLPEGRSSGRLCDPAPTGGTCGKR